MWNDLAFELKSDPRISLHIFVKKSFKQTTNMRVYLYVVIWCLLLCFNSFVATAISVFGACCEFLFSISRALTPCNVKV